MSLLRLAAILLFSAVAGPCLRAEQTFRIAGYLPEYRVKGLEATDIEGLTDLVVFSIQPRANATLDASAWPKEKLRKAGRLARSVNARLLVAVGGWGRSAGFAEMTRTDESRGRFARELLTFCKAHGFAGVAYDWEFPRNSREEAGMSKLLGDTRRLFGPSGRTVEIAVNPAKNLPKEWTIQVDAVQVMSYDNDARHATYEQAVADLDAMTRDAHPKKLLLGLPFYGRGTANRNKAMSYAEIHRRFRPKADQDEAGGYFFNGPATLTQKVKLARTRGLGGVMVWEIGQDAEDGDSLLRTIVTTANKTP